MVIIQCDKYTVKYSGMTVGGGISTKFKYNLI